MGSEADFSLRAPVALLERGEEGGASGRAAATMVVARGRCSHRGGLALPRWSKRVVGYVRHEPAGAHRVRLPLVRENNDRAGTTLCHRIHGEGMRCRSGAQNPDIARSRSRVGVQRRPVVAEWWRWVRRASIDHFDDVANVSRPPTPGHTCELDRAAASSSQRRGRLARPQSAGTAWLAAAVADDEHLTPRVELGAHHGVELPHGRWSHVVARRSSLP